MRDLLVDKRVVAPHTQELPGGGTREWKAPPFTATVKCVCKRCNAGWMSDLENAVKPHLAPLIRANPRIVSNRAQAALAAWTYLKVLLFSQWPEPSGVFTERDHHVFAVSRKPPGSARVTVAAYHADTSLAHFTYKAVDLTQPDGAVVDPDVSRAQLATLTINHVVLQLFTHALPVQIDYLPKTEYTNASDAIWPTRLPFAWPTQIMNHAALEEYMRPHGRAVPQSGHVS